MFNITTLRKGELVQLNDDYVLEELQHALVSGYPTHILLEPNTIVGNGKSTCKELIRLKARRDLPNIEMQLKDLAEAVNKLKEIIGE